MKRDLAALTSRRHDVLVIGGGIAGAWAVWDAASRGLSAALIEAEDFGQATSWSSAKTAHGGLRHLQRLDLAAFRESVRERRTLLRVAPEIVVPLPFVAPAETAFRAATFRFGAIANDLLSFDRNTGVRSDRGIGPSRFLSPSRLREAFPDLESAGIPRLSQGALVWHDAQVTHTERLLLSLLHQATESQACVSNHVSVTSGKKESKGWRIRCHDHLAEVPFDVEARAIINASGRQIFETATKFGVAHSESSFVRGMNLVLKRPVVKSRIAIGGRDGARFLFVMPWLDRTIVGTFYDDGQAPLAALYDEALRATASAFPWADVSAQDVVALHHGFVPGTREASLITNSRVFNGGAGLISVLTAKYTTARSTAERAVDLATRAASIDAVPSRTAETPLRWAKPLAGEMKDQIETAMKEELAATVVDVVRGRLLDGAAGRLPRVPDELFAPFGVKCDDAHQTRVQRAIHPFREA